MGTVMNAIGYLSGKGEESTRNHDTSAAAPTFDPFRPAAVPDTAHSPPAQFGRLSYGSAAAFAPMQPTGYSSGRAPMHSAGATSWQDTSKVAEQQLEIECLRRQLEEQTRSLTSTAKQLKASKGIINDKDKKLVALREENARLKRRREDDVTVMPSTKRRRGEKAAIPVGNSCYDNSDYVMGMLRKMTAPAAFISPPKASLAAPVGSAALSADWISRASAAKETPAIPAASTTEQSVVSLPITEYVIFKKGQKKKRRTNALDSSCLYALWGLSEVCRNLA